MTKVLNIQRKTNEPVEIILRLDGNLDFAILKHRHDKNCKNQVFSLSKLYSKLSCTHYTHETSAEYQKANPNRRDGIKDIGGFVGGLLSDGRRKKNSVLHRQLLTLDIDFAKTDFWNSFVLLNDYSAAIYSTHSHTPKSPRFRLIIPLDRYVTPEEYVAIARKIAGDLGIEQFDHTTYQPERLMYWPSTSKDGEYVFEYQDGEWLKADDVLNSYHDWKDSSSWPVGERETKKEVFKNIKEQQDPLLKTGMVGTFCRAYTVHEIITEHLPDVYDACDLKDRYSFKGGTTTAGLVTYDDKFAFSHHSTDPISGKLCNVFDLVREHKFGSLDENTQIKNVVDRPSYKAMEVFVSKDERYREQKAIEMLQSAKDDFEIELPEDDHAWMKKLKTNSKNEYLNTITNLEIIIEHDPNLKNKIKHDEFSKRDMVVGPLPWVQNYSLPFELSDTDESGIISYLAKVYQVNFKPHLRDALNTHCHKNKFNSMRDYLEAVQWDGTARIDKLLIDYMGADDNTYTRAIIRKTLVGAVARIYSPGIKFDTVLTLIGGQGKGKSTFINKLGMDKYSDDFGSLHTKAGAENIAGVWIMEVAELAGFRRADIETIKAFISRRTDRFRPAYGSRVIDYPRQTIFIASTNKMEFLKDTSGNRRFWPVVVFQQTPTKSLWADFNQNIINQVWAEAVKFYKEGETLHLSKELESIAFDVQNNHFEDDENTGLISEYLEKKIPATWDELNRDARRNFINYEDFEIEGTEIRNEVCVAEIWHEAFNKRVIDKMPRVDALAIHDIMRRLDGWVEMKGKKRFGCYGIAKGYKRIHRGVADPNKAWQRKIVVGNDSD